MGNAAERLCSHDDDPPLYQGLVEDALRHQPAIGDGPQRPGTLEAGRTRRASSLRLNRLLLESVVR